MDILYIICHVQMTMIMMMENVHCHMINMNISMWETFIEVDSRTEWGLRNLPWGLRVLSRGLVVYKGA